MNTAERPRRYDKRAPRRLREATGLALEAAAAKAGLARQTLMYLERGMTVPRADTMAKLARVYGVDINAFYKEIAA